MGEEWLDGYDGQTTDELLALSDQFRLDSIVLAFEQAIQQKANASREERCILAVEALEREVNNGGYEQFFGNSRTEFLDLVVEALQAISCPGTAAITHDAIDALHLDDTTSEGALEERLLSDDPKLRATLSSCDERYYASGEAIADQLFRWIARNRALIRIGGA